MDTGGTTQILLVGPAACRPEIAAHLARHGHETLAAESVEEVMRLLQRWKVACVLADTTLEEPSGLTMAARVARSEPAVPVVLLADSAHLATALAELRAGAMDCLLAEARPDEILAGIGRAIQRHQALMRERAFVQLLREELATLSAELRRERERRDRIALAAMESLVCVVEAKDLWLAGHSVRIAHTAASLAAELGRTDIEVEQVRLAGRLHDIGMVGVSDQILAKEGPLTPQEFDEVRAHVTIGSQILTPMPGMGEVASFVRHHHERWDGQGYPDSLIGDAAPWGARVIGLAEIYDALTTTRPYRQPMAPDYAVEHLKTLVGTTIGPAEWGALAAVVARREALVFVVDAQAQSSVGARAATIHV